MRDTEVVEFAARLRSLESTWETEATPSARRSSRFARQILMIRPRWEQLDTGFERDEHVSARRARVQDQTMVEHVRLRLTDYAGRWDQVLDAFAGMSGALHAPLGEPTDRRPGADAAVHWAGRDTTLVLECAGGSVYLGRVTNRRLHLDEELLRMDEEGLL